MLGTQVWMQSQVPDPGVTSKGGDISRISEGEEMYLAPMLLIRTENERKRKHFVC